MQKKLYQIAVWGLGIFSGFGAGECNGERKCI